MLKPRMLLFPLGGELGQCVLVIVEDPSFGFDARCSLQTIDMVKRVNSIKATIRDERYSMSEYAINSRVPNEVAYI